MRAKRLWFPGISFEIEFLRKLINDWRALQWCRELACDIVFEQYGCKPKDFLQHAVCIAEWCQDNVTYVNELPETFQTPMRTVDWGYGDCDDFVILEGCLMEAVGIPVHVVGMKLDGEWVHVFPKARVLLPDGEQLKIPLDCTLDQPVRTLPDPVADSLRKGYKVETLTL